MWDGHGRAAVFKVESQRGPPVLAQGTLLNVLGQPGWEASVGENGYMCVYE